MNMPAGQGGPSPIAPEIPDLKKMDLQMLMQDNAAARREASEARREIQKRVDEERDRARYEINRVRADLDDKLKKAERENDALIDALGRLRQENSALREENLILKIDRSNGYSAAPEPKETDMRPSAIPMPMAVGPVGSGPTVPMVPIPRPALGKPVPPKP